MAAVDLETWFPGDSEMARRMRAETWSDTPFGDHSQWPENLRLCVNLCLTSHVATVLWWGPRFTALYNDACIDLLGPQIHPRLLGRAGADAWPEVWETLGPVLEGLRAGRQAAGDHQFTCFYARTRLREEVHLKFACSPILSGDGRQVAGIFSTVAEVTPAVVEERRLTTLRRLADVRVTPGGVAAACRQAAEALEANPYDVAFAAIYALQGSSDALRLLATAGLPSEHPLPAEVGSTDTGWLRSAFVHGRPELFATEARGLRLPGGAWPEPAAEVLVLPLQSFGQQRPFGLLVAGVSPRLVLDSGYRTFLEMAGEHIGWALARASAPLRSGTVLLIEHDSAARDALRRMLEQEVDVLTADDGSEALEIARRRSPDVVIAELGAARPDDFALLRTWRADPLLQPVPVLLIAGRPADNALRDGLAAGADDQLVKPFTTEELIARVRGYVALSRSRREHRHTALQAAFTEAQRRAREAEEANARLEQLQVRLAADLDVMNRLHELATRLVATHELPVVLEEILDAAIALHGADFGNIKLYDPIHRTLVIAAQRGFEQPSLEYFAAVHAEDTSECSQALRERERVVVADVETDPRFAPHRAIAAQTGFRSVVSLPIISRDGEPKGVLSTHFRTPHTPSERELRLSDLYLRLAAELIERAEAEDALREADRRKDEFLATLAHELRNPLAPIRNGLAIARLTSRGNAELLRTVDMMDRQLSHLVHLVDDLLDMGRIRSGKVQLRLAPVTLTDAIDRSIEASRPLIDERRHRLVVDLEPVPLTVRGDLDRLAQVFSNLLSNATKYTASGGTITVRLRREQREAVIRVSDTGRGIAASELTKVFDLFTQGRTLTGTVDSGLGIGLALVRALVEMHGGSVSAESPGPGAGSTFTVRLPLLADAAVARADGSMRERSADRNTRAPRPLRILVVDDNEDSARSLAALLALQGHDVQVAFDGAAAVERARATPPDAVFLDLRMPKMDGMTAARHLRALPDGERLRIFAMTGWGQARDRERTRRAGFDAHLVKPVESGELENLLASFAARAPVAS